MSFESKNPWMSYLLHQFLYESFKIVGLFILFFNTVSVQALPKLRDRQTPTDTQTETYIKRGMSFSIIDVFLWVVQRLNVLSENMLENMIRYSSSKC